MVDLKVRVTGDAREARAMFSEMTSAVTMFGSETDKTMTAVQKRIAALVDAPKIDLVDTKSAADSARVFEELSLGAARLRADLDPVGTALSHIDDLFRRGAITAAEFGAASARALAKHQSSAAFIGPRANPFADDVAAAGAEVQARLSQGRYDALLGVSTSAPKSAADSASVFADAARAGEEMERRVVALRAAIDPLGAAQAKVNAELAEYRVMAGEGRISSAELAQAELMAATEIANVERAVAMRRRSSVPGRLSGWEKQQLVYQVNDVLTMGMMGASPFQILASQGGQVYQVLAGVQGGVTGAVKGLATEIWGLMGPTGAAAAGLLALSAAGYAYLAETRDLSKVLEEHKGIVDEVAAARARAVRGGGDAAGVVSSSVASAVMKAHEQDLGKLSDELSRKLRDETRTVSAGGVLGQIAGLDTDWTRVKGKFAPFEAEIGRLVASIRTGKPAIIEFQEAVSRRINAAPLGSSLVEAGGDLLKFSKDAASAARFLTDLQQRFSETALAAKTYSEAFRALSGSIPDYLSPDRLASTEKYRLAVGKIYEQYNEALGNQQGNPQAAAELERRRSLALAAARDDHAATTAHDILLANRKPGTPEHAARQLNDDLARIVAQSMEAMRAAGRPVPQISEGYRTAEEQVALWKKDPIRAAKPGTSLHERGLAVDMSRNGMSEDDYKFFVAEMERRGAVRAARDAKGNLEPWHFSLRGTALDDDNKKSLDTFGKDESWKKAVVDFRKGNDEIRIQNSLLGQSPDLLARQRAEIELTAQAERIYGADAAKVRKDILSLAEARGTVTRIATQEKLAYQSMHDAAQFVGEGIADGVTNLISRVETFDQAAKRLIQSLLQASIQAMLLGQGPLAGLFGTASPVSGQMGGLFGGLFSGMFGSGGGGIFSSLGKFFGFYADGGTIPAGGFGIAGEAGAELILGPSTVVPMRDLDSVPTPSNDLWGAGGAISNVMSASTSVTVNMNGSSGDAARDRAHADYTARAVKRVLDEHAADFARDQMRPGGLFRKKDLTA